MYERRKQSLLSRGEFTKRVGRHGLVAFVVLIFGLGIGVLGYHFFAHLNWIDSLLNASMILGGMGPVDPLPTNAAKIFASLYALFSGLALSVSCRSCWRLLCIGCSIDFMQKSVNNNRWSLAVLISTV
jgi:hypothetical protein